MMFKARIEITDGKTARDPRMKRWKKEAEKRMNADPLFRALFFEKLTEVSIFSFIQEDIDTFKEL